MFIPKEWKDRLVEFAGRRKLTNVATGEEMIADVTREEGTVSQAGSAFSAAEMNDLEQRVADGFVETNGKLAGCWIEFTDEEGNPTTEPYVHWLEEVSDEEV